MDATARRIVAFEEPTGSFTRSARRLSDDMKHELSKAVDELLTGTLPPAFPVDGAPYPPTISDDAVRLE